MKRMPALFVGHGSPMNAITRVSKELISGLMAFSLEKQEGFDQTLEVLTQKS